MYSIVIKRTTHRVTAESSKQQSDILESIFPTFHFHSRVLLNILISARPIFHELLKKKPVVVLKNLLIRLACRKQKSCSQKQKTLLILSPNLLGTIILPVFPADSAVCVVFPQANSEIPPETACNLLINLHSWNIHTIWQHLPDGVFFANSAKIACS